MQRSIIVCSIIKMNFPLDLGVLTILGGVYMETVKRTVEGTSFIHINDVKEHLDNEILNGNWENGCSIAIITMQDHIIIAYKLGDKSVRTKVNISSTKVGYGMRLWFDCPSCNHKRAKIYMVNGVFACRECNDLTYMTCKKSGNKLDYLSLQIWRQQKKLGMDLDKTDIHDLPYFKPKNMHWKTFVRERERLELMQLERDKEWLRLCGHYAG